MSVLGSKDFVFYVDLEVYDYENTRDPWVQAKYLAHGTNDVLWTNDLRHALQFLEAQIKEGLS